MREIKCGRCLATVRHGRARGVCIAFCNCLSESARCRLEGILRGVEPSLEVEAQYTT